MILKSNSVLWFVVCSLAEFAGLLNFSLHFEVHEKLANSRRS